MRNPLLDSDNSEKSVEGTDNKPQPLPFIPDDIIIYILKRVDVRDIVVRCRCVCKKWKDLISEEDPLMPSRLPMIYSKSGIYLYEKPLAVDKWWATKTPMHRVGSNLEVKYADCSQNGFILSEKIDYVSYWNRQKKVGYEYIVTNPVTREEVKIFHRQNSPHAKPVIFGIFFHPIRKEYCTLWKTWVNDIHHIQYKVLDLGSKLKPPPLWRNIGDLLNHKWREEDTKKAACLDNGFMYWLAADAQNKNIIIAFDIKTENLTRMPLPSDNHDDSYLSSLVINGEGRLSLVQIVVDGNKPVKVKIWTLKDGRIWTASQNVYYQNLWGIKRNPRAVAIANNELLFEAIGGKHDHDQSKRLLVCNIIQSKPGTMKKLTIRRKKSNHPLCTRFWAHHPTIASLKNCQPVIHI